MTVKSYCELIAWQKAMDLVEEVYKITKRFPKEELYGLTNQLRRAAVSIPSNIAEGQSRGSRDFVRFLSIAHGSLSETETQMEIAVRLGYAKRTDLARFAGLAAEVGRLINGLSNSIEKHAAAN
ncbi:MAG TPA: four helix bundle protein [Bryobacteraceae bacterium]|nr:four helix bundle protein [Bryobacteraceae bacterium]